MSTQAMSNEASIYKYFAMIPNMADDDLDLYEYRLYGHYWRVCGANNKPCIESERTSYTKCKMSQNTFRKARQGLIDKGFITMTEDPTPNEKGKKGTSATIILNDIWLENVTRYTPKKTQDESSEMRPTALDESSEMRTPPMNESSGSPKNNGIIKTQDNKRKKIDAPASGASHSWYDLASALVQAFGYTWDDLPKSEHGKYYKVAKDIGSGWKPITPAQVASLVAYAKEHPRGRNLTITYLPSFVGDWRNSHVEITPRSAPAVLLPKDVPDSVPPPLEFTSEILRKLGIGKDNPEFIAKYWKDA